MNKNIIGVIVAVVAVVGIIGVVLANKSDDPAPSSSTSDSAGMDDMGGMDMDNGNSSNEGGGEEDLTGQTEVTMDIQDFDFAKQSITVSKGTKVTWTNRDEAKHNVVSEEDGGPDGELLAQGESYDFTFDTVGTFNYICEPHPYMKAVVNVVE